MAFKKLKLWFDEELCNDLGNKITQIDPSFPKEAFLSKTVPQLNNLELKGRVACIGHGFHLFLTGNYRENIDMLLQVLGPENQEETGMFTNYYHLMPIASYVEQYGLDDFSHSMKAIEEITKRNTGEYTIRPFLVKYPLKTLKQMTDWSHNENFHIRRLACEGMRPRLPWAKKMDSFIADPSPILPILDQLKDDSAKYVQKSVANCLNDILKDHRDIFEHLIENWQNKATPQRKWIMKHALRNLVKKNDKWALSKLMKIK